MCINGTPTTTKADAVAVEVLLIDGNLDIGLGQTVVDDLVVVSC